MASAPAEVRMTQCVKHNDMRRKATRWWSTWTWRNSWIVLHTAPLFMK
jgi:hypothetical protein